MKWNEKLTYAEGMVIIRIMTHIIRYGRSCNMPSQPCYDLLDVPVADFMTYRGIGTLNLAKISSLIRGFKYAVTIFHGVWEIRTNVKKDKKCSVICSGIVIDETSLAGAILDALCSNTDEEVIREMGLFAAGCWSYYKSAQQREELRDKSKNRLIRLRKQAAKARNVVKTARERANEFHFRNLLKGIPVGVSSIFGSKSQYALHSDQWVATKVDEDHVMWRNRSYLIGDGELMTIDDCAGKYGSEC